MLRIGRSLLVVSIAMLALAGAAKSQTTAFTYQGNLTDGGNAANGNFQMQFKLFDALAGGTQIGSTITNVPVTAAAGAFTARLDFGAPALTGANRWIEIAVRRNATESYVTLSPREQIASSPYAVRTLSAAMADDSQKLGGVNAAEYLTTTSANGSFIRNGSSPQTASFNITGNGTFGGQVGINTSVNPNFQVDILGGTRSYSPASTHFVAETTSPSPNAWARFYMRSAERSWFMGTSRAFNGNQLYVADETAGQIRMAIATNGFVGINTSNPQAGLEVSGTGALSQQRITDTASGNSLVLQSGTGINTKITGYNYGTGTGVPLYVSVDGANTIINPAGGNVGIGVLAPTAKLTVGGNLSQSSSGFGVPKAIVFVQANGTIGRCYNGISGQTSGGCGFSVSGSGGTYSVNFGFDVSARFYSMTSSSIWLPGVSALAGRLGFDGSTPNSIFATFWRTFDAAVTPSDFTLIVY